MRLGGVPFRSAYTPGRRQPCSELGRKLYFLHFTMTRPFIPAHGGFVNDCHLRAINSAALCFSLTWESTPLPTPPSFSGISCALAPSAPAAPLEQGVCHPPGPPTPTPLASPAGSPPPRGPHPSPPPPSALPAFSAEPQTFSRVPPPFSVPSG